MSLPAQQPHQHQFTDGGVPQLFFGNHKEWRSWRYKISMRPQIVPGTDPTIDEVVAAREMFITELVKAMYNFAGMYDGLDSPAVVYFTLGGAQGIDGRFIEAACRALFDIVLDRCYNGFRGPHQDNECLRPAHGCDSDREGNCLTRMWNVIGALRASKALCQEIIYDDYKCILLANAPLGRFNFLVRFQEDVNNWMQSDFPPTQVVPQGGAEGVQNAAFDSKNNGGPAQSEIPSVTLNLVGSSSGVYPGESDQHSKHPQLAEIFSIPRALPNDSSLSHNSVDPGPDFGLKQGSDNYPPPTNTSNQANFYTLGAPSELFLSTPYVIPALNTRPGGGVTNFPQDKQDVSKDLPHTPSESGNHLSKEHELTPSTQTTVGKDEEKQPQLSNLGLGIALWPESASPGSLLNTSSNTMTVVPMSVAGMPVMSEMSDTKQDSDMVDVE
ncbi:hypothetical protein BDV95DRAFT_618789 [Massariosphaeria phaeospora]|uniref:Uncharacterized protein n=1 Tax=Massariosphaeria phaeospora TaxID=100035 RepID=A0A7C8MK92_9PLEO|nr:hypothetical protein BDV95DRAFT_618789 [Massariosphaeria phaeospora]